MYHVTKIIETCGGCPSQWSGRIYGGAYLYIRYRWGGLRVEVDDNIIFQESVGDGLDGVMGFDELQQHVGHLLDFSDAKWVENQEELYEN